MEAPQRVTGVLWRTLAASLALLGSLSGCPPKDHDPPSDLLTDPAEVLALGQRGHAGLKTFVADARATHYSDQGAFKGKLEILLRQPASVHLAALSPTDDVVGATVSDGENFSSFERGAEVCYMGEACAANIGRFLPVPMEGEALLNALLGVAPFIPHGERSVSWDRRAGAYRLELVGQRALQRVWVAHGSGMTKRVQLLEGDTVTVELAYSNHSRIGGYLLPGRIDIKTRHDSVDMRLDYRNVEVNRPLKDAAFVPSCPDKTRVEVLPCLSQAGQ